MTNGWAAVSSAVRPVNTACNTYVTTFAGRASQRDADKSHLQILRETSLADYARLQAVLAHLTTSETDAMASFEATVAQRAEEAFAFGKALGASTKEAQALQGVLQILQEKRAASGHAVAGSEPPQQAEAGERFVFVRTSDYDYPDGCADNSQVTVQQVNFEYALPVQVKWISGFSFWVKFEDMRTIQTVSTSGNLDGIIGTFQGLANAAGTDAANDAKEHADKDAQLLSLVKSYKDTLLHIDSEYQEKNGAASTAAATASGASGEIGVHNSVAAEEGQVLALLQQLCGYAGEESATGLVADTQHRGAALLETYTRQVEQSLITMNGIIESGAAALLQASGKPRLRGRAARWLAAAKARGLNPLPPPSQHGPRLRDPNVDPPQPLARVRSPASAAASVAGRGSASAIPKLVAELAPQRVEVAVSVSHGRAGRAQIGAAIAPHAAALAAPRMPAAAAPSRSEVAGALRQLAKLLPATHGGLAANVQVLSALVGGASGGAAVVHATANQPDQSGYQNAANMTDLEACVEEKTNVTAQIVNARRGARTERTNLALATQRLQSLPRWVDVMQACVSLVESAKTDIGQAFGALTTTATSGSYDAAVASALSSFSSAEAAIEAYMPGAGPEAAGLPGALVDIKATLVRFRDEVPGDLEALLIRGGGLSQTSDGLLMRLGQAQGAVETVAGVTEDLVHNAANSVNKFEALEEELMNQRMELETRCEATIAEAAAAQPALAEAAAPQPGS